MEPASKNVSDEPDSSLFGQYLRGNSTFCYINFNCTKLLLANDDAPPPPPRRRWNKRLPAKGCGLQCGTAFSRMQRPRPDCLMQQAYKECAGADLNSRNVPCWWGCLDVSYRYNTVARPRERGLYIYMYIFINPIKKQEKKPYGRRRPPNDRRTAAFPRPSSHILCILCTGRRNFSICRNCKPHLARATPDSSPDRTANVWRLTSQLLPARGTS
ncbi:unnamed protein product [Ixodes persulcatus]